MEVRTFSLGAGADTVVFANNTTNNGVDEITNFKAGNGGDKLDFTTNALLTASSSKFETIKNVTAAAESKVSGSNHEVIVLSEVADLAGITFDTSGTDANKLGLNTNQKYVIITDKDGDNTAGNIYYVETGADFNSQPNKVLIGTVMRDGDIGDYVLGNFTGIVAS